jgi:hypothetical protein
VHRRQREGWTILVYIRQDLCREPLRVAREIAEMYSRLTRRPA